MGTTTVGYSWLKKKNIELEMYLPLTLVKLKLPSAKHTNNYGKYWKITIVNG